MKRYKSPAAFPPGKNKKPYSWSFRPALEEDCGEKTKIWWKPLEEPPQTKPWLGKSTNPVLFSQQ